MKIKNMKLMLLGLLAMGSMNAFAAVDEESRSVNDVLYKLETTGTAKTATVVGVNTLASAANQETISIPATVTGEHGTYNVTGFATGWESKVLNVTAKVKTLSIDVTNFTATLDGASAFNALTKVETLTITDTGAAATSKTKKFDGSGAAFKTTLKTLNISGSNINEIAANGLQGYTALEAIDLTGIVTIGANAFDGCNNAKLKSLTIPATVTKIGAKAFDNMTKLETLVYQATTTDLTVPAAFAGDAALKSITIASANATTIASTAFTSTVVETIDLSGSPALATITGAFATSTKLVTVNMAGSKVVASDAIDISGSKASLETWTCANGVQSIPALAGFVKLKALDFTKADATKTTLLNTATFTGNKAMESFKANPVNMTTVAASAFENCEALATIEGVLHANTTSIGNDAFKNSGLTTLDLSVLNLQKFGQTIPAAFSQMKKLIQVTLPSKQKGTDNVERAITTITAYAFADDAKLASINLDATEITTLPILFQTALTTDETFLADLTALTLPKTLTAIQNGALQFLGLTSIVIPETVANGSFGNRVLQGCVNLAEFSWENAQQNYLDSRTFLGDTKLAKVTFVTKNYIPATWALSDDFFKMCDKEVLKVYVSSESYDVLYAAGWTDVNAKYSKLVRGSGDAKAGFADKNKAADGFYYMTYFNEDNATWFPADKFEVFSAVVDGNKVALKPATVKEGYYKIKQLNAARTNQPQAICVIRSTEKDAKYELKSIPLNAQESTLPTDNHLLVADANNETTKAKVGSKINFMFQLAKNKAGVVAFYRVTSGAFKNNSVYIDASPYLARPIDVLDIEIEGETTAINKVQAAEAGNDAIYNLSGMRLKSAQKGIYIKNGKKYIK